MENKFIAGFKPHWIQQYTAVMQIKSMKLSHTLQWKTCQVAVSLADLQVYSWLLEISPYHAAVVSDLMGGSTSPDFVPFHNRRQSSSRWFSSHFFLLSVTQLWKVTPQRIKLSPSSSSCSPTPPPREPTYRLLATIFRTVWFARANSCSLYTRKILLALTEFVSYTTPAKNRTLMTRKCKIARII